MDLLILDADGVFMNEAPYWKTALAAALVWHGLSAGSAQQWESLASARFVEERIQRITKGRRCNSNWDLAAVMIRALEPRESKEPFVAALREGQWSQAARTVAGAMQRMHSGELSVVPPVAAFGIDRHGDFFQEVVARYQDVFQDRAGLDWPFARHELAGASDHLHKVFDRLRGLGYSLGVCTSRDRNETLLPMQELGILDWFDRAHIATHDEALEAQKRTGIRPLQKPHWFPLACALLGLEAAVDAVLGGRLPDAQANGRHVFVGDTTSDFDCARSCMDRGLRLDYIHVDSGLTGEGDLDEVHRHPATRGVAPDLAGIISLVGDVSS